jgi:hypothetical protein
VGVIEEPEDALAGVDPETVENLRLLGYVD